MWFFLIHTRKRALLEIEAYSSPTALVLQGSQSQNLVHPKEIGNWLTWIRYHQILYSLKQWLNQSRRWLQRIMSKMKAFAFWRLLRKWHSNLLLSRTWAAWKCFNIGSNFRDSRIERCLCASDKEASLKIAFRISVISWVEPKEWLRAC